MQTAKTVAPGSTRGAISEVLVNNDLGPSDTGTESRSWKPLGPQLDYRLGVTEHTDLGIGSFLIGLRTDMKFNVAAPSARWGLAPRVGIGIGEDLGTGDVVAPFAGVIGSWHPWTELSLYGGFNFTNYWITPHDRPSWAEDQAGESEASSTGWGDGVMQLSAGLALSLRGDVSLIVEYGLLRPAQDNPRDYYRFVQSHLLAGGFTF